MAQYTVQSGDTLYLIARRFNTTIERLLQLNSNIDPNNLRVGQVIIVPDMGGMFPALPPGMESYNTRVVDGLLYVLASNRVTYRRGENVRLSLLKCNISRRNITLFYNTSQRVDFAAFRGGREVWRWSRDQFFTQAAGRVTLSPGECQTYNVVWNQLNNQGRQVAADNFIIRGYNVASGLSGIAVEKSITITAAPVPQPPPTPVPPPAPEPCPQGNLLANSSFETWPDPAQVPDNWRASNIYRTNLANFGRFAAELGAIHNRRATLSQTVNASEGRIYRLAFYARENEQPGGVSRFQLQAEVLFYNRAGELVGRADPLISQAGIPNNSYQLYTLSTATTPRTTARAEVRFVFIPDANNDNTVKIDNVEFTCLR